MSARLTIVRDGDTTVAVVLAGAPDGTQHGTAERLQAKPGLESVPVFVVPEAWGEVDVQVIAQPLAADPTPAPEQGSRLSVEVPPGIDADALHRSIQSRIQQLVEHG